MSTTATVISLESHPARRASTRRSREMHEAMRRHPCYQAKLLSETADDSESAVILDLGR